MPQEFPELSCYLLPGHSQTPADAMQEAKDAEALGLGKVWLSERFDVKDAGVICSAALAVTENLKVATAATNLHTRHPMILATMCSSLHYISNGRFELGLARGVAIRNQLMGLDSVNNKKLVDGLEVLRTLWQGEKVVAYDGPLGNLPYLSMGDWLDADIPVHFVGFGPKSLKFAGTHFDGIHLHTFVTPEGLTRARTIIDEAAAAAERPPAKICTVMATVLNPSREDHLHKLVARMATYMQAPGYVEMLADLNQWDASVLETFRSNELVSSILGGIDSVATLEQLERIEPLIPADWIESVAVGSAEDCAKRLLQEFEYGADEVCIHGSSAAEIAPILNAYRRLKHA